MIIIRKEGKFASELSFPLHGRISRTVTGALVLRPEVGWITYFVRIPSVGYYGRSLITGVTGKDVEIIASGTYFHYALHGGRGYTAWALVSARGPIIVTGQLTCCDIYPCYIDQSEQFTAIRYTPDGETEKLIPDPPRYCTLIQQGD